LDEFRSSKNRQWSIFQIEGHVVDFCMDQNGSRFIQQRLEMGDQLEQQIVAREVLPAIRRLRNDVFGNYVVQKLLDFGSQKVRANIRDTLEGEMLQLSLQMYGCRVVQKVLETLPEDDIARLLSEFHHNVLCCIHDQNGNHVIQKCIEVMSSRARKAVQQNDEALGQFLRDQIDFIIDDVLANTTTLSCHPYGCRVLQRMLEHCNDEKKFLILDEIKSCHRKLLDDQYGNYVIQHVLQFGREEDRDSIVQIVVESGLLGLSRQKFASNVVEKLLKYGNSNQRRAVVREMLHVVHDPSIPNQAPGGTSVVLLMVRDAYANYVVQTTLDVVPESDEKVLLLRELSAHTEELVSITQVYPRLCKHCYETILINVVVVCLFVFLRRSETIHLLNILLPNS
jgi:pumilio RNA-binding family